MESKEQRVIIKEGILYIILKTLFEIIFYLPIAIILYFIFRLPIFVLVLVINKIVGYELLTVAWERMIAVVLSIAVLTIIVIYNTRVKDQFQKQREKILHEHKEESSKDCKVFYINRKI